MLAKQTLIVILPSVLAMYALSKKYHYIAATIMIVAMGIMFCI